MPYAGLYLLLLNLFSLTMTRADKIRAIRRKWRIPESWFIWLAAFGGGVGIYAGCRIFRHKIKHPKFMIGVPVMVVLQVIALGCLYFIISKMP